MEGWISLHRKIFKSDVWQASSGTLKIWLALLIKATPFDCVTAGKIKLKKGETLTSITEIHRLAGNGYDKLTRRNVENSINFLKTEKMIEIFQEKGKKLRVKVCNYDTYQQNSGVNILSSNTGADMSGVNCEKVKIHKEYNNNTLELLNISLPTGKDIFPNSPETEFQAVINGMTVTVNAEFMIRVWNRFRGKFPEVKRLTGERKRKCKTRIHQRKADLSEYMTEFKDAIVKMQTARIGQSFFSFDWLIKNSNNIEKVLDGNYNRESSSQEITEIQWGKK